MIILPDRNIPRAKVLLPMKKSAWSSSQRSCIFGIADQNRWRLTARLNDGAIAWRGFFDDREDADAFVAALARHLALNEPMPLNIIRLVSEADRKCYGYPDWSPLLTEQNVNYQFDALCFLTATPGTLQEWIVPDDWRDPLYCPPFSTVDQLLAWTGSPAYLTSGTSSTAPGDFSTTNTVECIGGGGGSSRNGGGGGAYAKSVNLTGITGSITYQVGAAGAASGAGTDTWFNDSAFPTTGQRCGAKAGKGGGGAGSAVTGGSSASCYATGTGNAKYSGGGCPAGANSGAGAGGGGGGGAAGPNGAGADAGQAYDQGSGGGGNGGGSAGKASGSGTTPFDSPGGNGGNNSGGSGGGAGSTAGNNGGAGSNGGGGGGTPKSSAVNAGAGGAGQEWDSTHGSGGGGGGAGYLANPGAAALYGAGAGGAASSGGASIGGAQGIVTITYTASSIVLLPNSPMLGM